MEKTEIQKIDNIVREDTPKKRVAIYCRVSTDEQKEGKTIDSQIEECKRYCRAAGYEIVCSFFDDGWSGGNLARPALDQLRDRANNGEFEMVVCYAVDRLSRDQYDFPLVQGELERKGIKLDFVRLPNATENPEGELMVGVHSLFASYERKVILERTRRGRRYKVEVRKEFMGSKISLGYIYHKKDKSKNFAGKIEINEDEKKIVEMIFRWVVEEGMTTRGVIKELLRLSIPPKKGSRAWAKSTVLRVLKNENYIGKFYYNRRESVETEKHTKNVQYRKNKKSGRKWRPQSEWILLEFPHLRIISDEMFQAAQERLKTNSTFSKRNGKTEYLLRGLIKCGECGCLYYGDNFHGVPFYRDSNKKIRFPFPKNCNAGSIGTKRIETAIWNVVVEVLDNPLLIIEQLKKNEDLLRGEIDELKDNLRLLERQLQLYSDEEGRIIMGYQKGILSDVEVEEPIKNIREKKKSTQTAIDDLQERINAATASKDAPKAINDFCDTVRGRLKALSFKDKQDIVRLVIKEIILEADRVRIKGRIPTVEKAKNTPQTLKNNDGIVVQQSEYCVRQQQQ